jgi:hypothetical protein
MVVVNAKVNVNLIYLQMRVRPAGFELQAWRLCKPQGSIGPKMGPPVRDRPVQVPSPVPLALLTSRRNMGAKALVKNLGTTFLRTFGRSHTSVSHFSEKECEVEG